MPRIPNNLRERAIGMFDAGMSTEHVARHVGCSSRAIRRKEMFCLTTHSTHFLFMVIWRQTYGKGPLR